MHVQRAIRGSGLAYGAYVSTDREAGLLTFALYRVRLLEYTCYPL
jgi:Zn-dependent M16 (insulinase) family peptidase